MTNSRMRDLHLCAISETSRAQTGRRSFQSGYSSNDHGLESGNNRSSVELVYEQVAR